MHNKYKATVWPNRSARNQISIPYEGTIQHSESRLLPPILLLALWRAVW